MFTKKLFVPVLILILLAATVSAQEPLRLKLNAMERVVIMSMIPEKSSFANLRIYNDLRMELAPNEEEAVLLDAREAPNGGTIANWGAVPEKEITFGQITERLIVDALKKLDEKEELTKEHESLYLKFVLKETPEE